MKQKILFFTIILLLSINTHAQFKAGLSTGLTNNYLDTSIIYRSFTRYKPDLGFIIAFPLQYHFNKWLAIETDLSYIQKNYIYERTGPLSGISQTTINSYIQLPLIAHFSFGGEQLKGFTNLGVYAAYWANSRVKGKTLGLLDNIYTYDEKYQFNNILDNRLEIGLLYGLGIEYDFTQNYTFFIKIDYYYGISDLQKNYMINQIPRYNETFTFQIGCLVNLSNLQ